MGDEGGLLLIRGRRNKMLLGAAGIALLAIGIVSGPRGDATEPTIAVPPEPVAPLLEPSLHDPISGFRALRDAGAAAMQHAVSIAVTAARDPVGPVRSQADLARADDGSPTAPGIVVAPSRVLTFGLDFADAVARHGAGVADGRGQTLTARLERCDPSSGLVTLTVMGGEMLSPASIGRAPSPGSAAIAVARLATMPVASPVWIAGVDHSNVRLGLGPTVAGTGIFDAESRLVAIAGAGGIAWTAAEALARIEALPIAVPKTLGWTLQRITEDLRPLVPAAGVLVAAVDAGGPASRAGVLPGDVVTSLGDDVVVSPRDLMVALAARAAGTEFPIRLRRGGEERTHVAQARESCAPPDAGTGETVDGPPARDLFTAAALQAAGLDGGAVLLEIDGRPPVASRRPRRGSPLLVRAREAGRPPAYYALTP